MDHNKIKESFSNIIYLLLGALAGVGFISFVIISIPIYILRQVVILLAKWQRPDLGEVLNPLSTCFSHDLFSKQPPRASVVVTITATGSIKDQTIKTRILRNWIHAIDKNTGKLKYPQFQQYPFPWLGFIFFRNTPEPIDINNHFHYHENLGKGEVTKDQVEKFTEKLLNLPYFAERSPWEIHCVNNYRNDDLYPNQNLCLYFLRIHHSIADGYSILHALVEGLFEHPISEKDLPMPKLPKKSGWKFVRNLVIWPAIALYEVASILSQMFRPSPWRIPDKQKEWHQHCVKSDLIPIDKIKYIKNSFGVSFTSVLLSAISAGIHKNLKERKRSCNFNSEIDEKIFCLSTLPLPGHTRNLTNHVTSAIFEMPTNNCPSPSDRLYYLEKTMEVTKDSVIPYICQFYVSVVGSHFAPVTAWIMKQTFIATGLTNFPSIPIRAAIDESMSLEVDFVVGALEGGAGVAISALSFAQNIRVNVAAEKGLLSRKEVADFIENITNEINKLYKLAKHQERTLSTSG